MNLINQIPSTIEWAIYSGDTAMLTLVITDANNAAVDMTGYTITAQIREHKAQVAVDATIAVSANSQGLVTLTIADTNLLGEIQFFDVQTVDNVSGVVNTILKGAITTEKDVTR
tara:strand:- start:1580 stop:1921 length:342 start_codon:yes stop_codon:yes gene_type:complete